MDINELLVIVIIGIRTILTLACSVQIHWREAELHGCTIPGQEPCNHGRSPHRSVPPLYLHTQSTLQGWGSLTGQLCDEPIILYLCIFSAIFNEYMYEFTHMLKQIVYYSNQRP